MDHRDELIQELEARVRFVIRQFNQEFSRQMELEISVGEFFMLKKLSVDGSRRVSELARFLEVSLSHITALSDKLEKKGLLERTRCDQDRRNVYLSATEKGHQVMERFREMKRAYFKRIFAPISDDEIENMIHIYERIQQAAKSFATDEER